LQKLSDPLLTDCPSCGKAAYKKQLSAAGFQLKGSGWYATDFKNGGGAKPAETKAETKSDPAPACGQGACAACTPSN
jgi:predicted nucleic acid-binding Zn ribbon protein